MYGIPVKGTPTHGYVASFEDETELSNVDLVPKSGGQPRNMAILARRWRVELIPIFQMLPDDLNDGELAALISFAVAFPNSFMVSVDTFDVKRYTCQKSPSPAILTNLHNEYR